MLQMLKGLYASRKPLARRLGSYVQSLLHAVSEVNSWGLFGRWVDLGDGANRSEETTPWECEEFEKDAQRSRKFG